MRLVSQDEKKPSLEARLDQALADRRALFDDAPDGVFITDRDLRILEVNVRGAAMVRRTPEELVGLRVDELVATDDLRNAPLQKDEIASGTRAQSERKFLLPNGEHVYLEVLAQRAPDGRVIGFARDATQRRAAEAALRRSEESFRALIDTFPDGIVVHERGVALYVNPSLETLLGYPRGSLVGHDIFRHVHPEDRAIVAGRVGALSNPGSSLPFIEERLLRSDGSSVLCEVAAVAVSFEGRDAVAAVVRDITERVRIQAELAHADRMTTAGRLAAGVAHEINNPLTFVLLNLEHQTRVLESHLSSGVPLPRETLRVLTQGARFAHEGTERVAKIVKDLRMLGRREEEPLAALDVNDPLESALTLTVHEIEGRGRVERRFTPKATLVGSEGRLCQVFVNLLVNAAHSLVPSRASENRIIVTTSYDEDNVTVSIRDTGIGIPAHDLERVLVPFFTTKPLGSGTGLGLPISRDIVRAHGGELVLTSEVGKGTEVVVRLPRRPKSSASVPPPSVSEEAPRRAVLVIDDDEPVLRSITDLLSETYTVTPASTVAQAKELLSSRSFDLVLCDVTMPEWSGPDLLAWARAESIAVPFVLMSGAGPHSARDAKRASPVSFLEKPFRGAALIEAVESALDSLGREGSTLGAKRT